MTEIHLGQILGESLERNTDRRAMIKTRAARRPGP